MTYAMEFIDPRLLEREFARRAEYAERATIRRERWRRRRWYMIPLYITIFFAYVTAMVLGSQWITANFGTLGVVAALIAVPALAYAFNRFLGYGTC